MAQAAHEVGAFHFDAGGYAEFNFELYDTDGSRFATQTTDNAYIRIGTNGTGATLKFGHTASAGGSVISSLKSSSTGRAIVKLSGTDTGTTLSATTYDFNLYLIDASDSIHPKYFARGQFIVKSTIGP